MTEKKDLKLLRYLRLFLSLTNEDLSNESFIQTRNRL